MKHIFLYVGVTIAMIGSMGCKKKEEQPAYFSTQQEAANKAKSDLLTVLRSRKEIALGVDEQAIEKSQPGAPIRQFQIGFEDLAAADSLTALQRNEMATVVPLVADGSVATVVGMTKEETGWKVTSLGDKSLSSELDIVRKAAGPEANIVMYDLPHSGVKVYGVTTSGAGEAANVFYTNYTGFSLSEPASAERLLSVLKQDAAEFQRTYGEELKRQRIVR